MTNGTRKRQLIGKLQENGKNFDILGSVVWWNIREVRITQERFSEMLRQCGLDDSHAREHNYRSAFKRALKDLEEQRIIRLVEETNEKIIYQFTAETKVNGDGDPRLEYNPETSVVIHKAVYNSSQSFADAVTAREDIRTRLIELFHEHKKLYKSSDITRYLQRIFVKKADIISLRQQGSVYFVPATYTNVLDSVSTLVQQLGGACTLDRMPVLDVQDSRQMVRNAFTNEVDELYDALGDQIEEIQNNGKEISDKWVTHRLGKIKKIRSRINLYAEVLSDKADEMLDQFKSIEDSILGARKLSL